MLATLVWVVGCRCFVDCVVDFTDLVGVVVTCCVRAFGALMIAVVRQWF